MTILKYEIDRLSPTVRRLFLQWANFMYSHVSFNIPDSEIHAATHCERVLLYALLIGEKIFGDDMETLTHLAHAAVFHDSRRLNEYIDAGHGARAAEYYEDFCKQNTDIRYYPESAYLIRYHDLDDNVGQEAIIKHFTGNTDKVLKLYEIFKDSDALDRWRLGRNGPDSRFLRTVEAKCLVDFARHLVEETIPDEMRTRIEGKVNDFYQTANERTIDDSRSTSGFYIRSASSSGSRKSYE